MKRLTLIFSLTLAVIALALPSCNSSSSGYEADDDTLFDIVTVISSNSAGSSFSVQKDDNSVPVTLTSTTAIDTTQIGKRLLLAYTLPNGVSQYTGSTITLVGAYKVINDTVEVANTESLHNESLNLLVANMVGNYLDIKADCDVYSSPKNFKLVMDQDTEDSAYPTIYLLFNTDNQINASQKYVYASFNIAKLRNNEKYSGFNLKWNSSTSAVNGSRTYEFSNKLTPILPTE